RRTRPSGASHSSSPTLAVYRFGSRDRSSLRGPDVFAAASFWVGAASTVAVPASSPSAAPSSSGVASAAGSPAWASASWGEESSSPSSEVAASASTVSSASGSSSASASHAASFSLRARSYDEFRLGVSAAAGSAGAGSGVALACFSATRSSLMSVLGSQGWGRRVRKKPGRAYALSRLGWSPCRTTWPVQTLMQHLVSGGHPYDRVLRLSQPKLVARIAQCQAYAR